MSSSRQIKPKRDDTQLTTWESMPERAPSILRDDTPTLARISGAIGVFFAVLVGLSRFATAFGREAPIGPAWGVVLGSIGVVALLLHVMQERDAQFRFLYTILGMFLAVGGFGFGATLLLGHFASIQLPSVERLAAYYALGGAPAALVGLVVLIGVVRNEPERSKRSRQLRALIGFLGFASLVTAILAGLFWRDYLPIGGIFTMLLGLLFVGAYIGLQDPLSDKGYQAGMLLGAIAVFGFAAAVLRAWMPESNFLIPSGLILMGMSLLCGIVALGVCSDLQLVVLTRREMSSFFYSPIAYLVLGGMVVLSVFMFYTFTADLVHFSRQGGMPEPIIGQYIFSLIPVIVQMIAVPALTMRLFSEEKRSGTLDVLLCAPVSEWTVVLAKFVAAWFFMLLTWAPTFIFLVALRYLGGNEFDYRPALSFGIALLATTAGWIAMGVFCSSLTANQIVAAMFTFLGMTAHLIAYLIKREDFGPMITEVLTYVNYLDLWGNALQGVVAPRFLMFHVSLAVFFLFATVKILEMRKWK